MAKQQSFADKVMKAAMHAGLKCEKCGEIKQPTLLIDSVPSKHGGIRFAQTRVKVCKCNEKEIYG